MRAAISRGVTRRTRLRALFAAALVSSRRTRALLLAPHLEAMIDDEWLTRGVA